MGEKGRQRAKTFHCYKNYVCSFCHWSKCYRIFHPFAITKDSLLLKSGITCILYAWSSVWFFMIFRLVLTNGHRKEMTILRLRSSPKPWSNGNTSEECRCWFLKINDHRIRLLLSINLLYVLSTWFISWKLYGIESENWLWLQVSEMNGSLQLPCSSFVLLIVTRGRSFKA